MYEPAPVFESGGRRLGLALSFELDALIAEWTAVRREMRRSIPEAFEREEWAYMMSFVSAEDLRGVLATAFGDRATDGPVDALAVPREPVAVWLPNNVTLLGPLMTVLLSLTGAATVLKVGTRAGDLTAAFLSWLREHAPPGQLRSWARERVELLAIERDDPRIGLLAREAAVRVSFGTDDGVAGVEALSHPPTAQGFAFGDRRSEAWLSPKRIADPQVCEALVRVFAIYGQAGCTAPRRVVLVDGSAAQARELRDRLVDLWPSVLGARPPMHVASENLAAGQRAAAAGWEPRLTDGHSAMVACGAASLPVIESVQSLFITAADLDGAIASGPPNLQTIGHALEAPESSRWSSAVLRSGAERFVPLTQMHHFGPVWDGHAYWRALFREVEMAA